VAGRSRGQVASCAVCTWHVETRSAGFLVEHQNQGRRFCEWFGLKTTRTVSSSLGSKPAATVFASLGSKLVATDFPDLASKPVVGFLVEPQNQGGGGFPGLDLKTGSYGFSDLGLKITATVSWFGSQNQSSFGLSVASQNRRREVGAGHTSKSSNLLGVEASLTRVSQSSLKTGGGAMMDGARGTIAEVASEAS
jgi:hypothetical protein